MWNDIINHLGYNSMYCRSSAKSKLVLLWSHGEKNPHGHLQDNPGSEKEPNATTFDHNIFPALQERASCYYVFRGRVILVTALLSEET